MRGFEDVDPLENRMPSWNDEPGAALPELATTEHVLQRALQRRRRVLGDDEMRQAVQPLADPVLDDAVFLVENRRSLLHIELEDVAAKRPSPRPMAMMPPVDVPAMRSK